MEAVHSKVTRLLDEEFDAAKSYKYSKKDWLASHW